MPRGIVGAWKLNHEWFMFTQYSLYGDDDCYDKSVVLHCCCQCWFGSTWRKVWGGGKGRNLSCNITLQFLLIKNYVLVSWSFKVYWSFPCNHGVCKKKKKKHVWKIIDFVGNYHQEFAIRLDVMVSFFKNVYSGNIWILLKVSKY